MEFNHVGHQKSTILVVTKLVVSQPFSQVMKKIGYQRSRKFGLDQGGAAARHRWRARHRAPR
ncbi:MAG: hypothetical protein ACM3ML_33525 [Micromonosporaceae bacterium]